MKKFLKTLLILVLIIGAVAGTCFIFYSNMAPKKDSFISLTNFLSSNEKSEVDSNVESLKTTAGVRFQVVEDTISHLNDFASMQQNYLSYEFKDVKGNKISKGINELISIQSEIISMIDEYEKKLSNTTFDSEIGANELYYAYADYIFHYSDLIKIINNQIIENLKNPNYDIKFAITELYCDVAKLTFNDFNENEIVEIKNANNINFMNTKIILQDDYINISNPFSANNNKFINAYNQCKIDFAKVIKQKVSNATTFSEELTNVEKTAFYFKAIWGV